MEIGIIGTGQIGGTLARRLTKLGHEVYVANSRGPASLADLAKETGAKSVTVREAARSGEVVVVTVPEAKIRTCPETCLPTSRRRLSSLTRAIITHGSETAASRTSRRE
jgi:8-hydroxy-5-deazaflavin:NADPH oxidoreductase